MVTLNAAVNIAIGLAALVGVVSMIIVFAPIFHYFRDKWKERRLKKRLEIKSKTRKIENLKNY